MKWLCSGVFVALVAAVSVSVSAQAGAAREHKMDSSDGENVTMIGCITRGVESAGYILTNVTHQDDKRSKHSVKHDATGTSGKTPEVIALSSTTVDLSKSVGQKVSVTGLLASDRGKTMEKSDNVEGGKFLGDSFTVKALKRISASCS